MSESDQICIVALSERCLQPHGCSARPGPGLQRQFPIEHFPVVALHYFVPNSAQCIGSLRRLWKRSINGSDWVAAARSKLQS